MKLQQSESQINYNDNKTRYEIGKHYYCLEGAELAGFKNETAFSGFVGKRVNRFYLWTEKGALLHAKSLNTDKAWEVYDYLVETYFRVRAMFQVPKTYPEALRMAADLAEQIEHDKPKVLLANAVTETESYILIRDLAKLLNQNGIDIGGNRLYKWLRDNGYLIKSGVSYNLPTQQSIDRKLFFIREKPMATKYNKVKTELTTMVTGNGQLYFINKFLTDVI